jgi:hypothetical protein
MSFATSPSGPTPQQLRVNRRGRVPSSTGGVDRSFGTAIWEQKLQKKVLKRKLKENLEKELFEETLSSLRKEVAKLDEDKWRFEKIEHGDIFPVFY